MKYNPFQNLPNYKVPPVAECPQEIGCTTWIIYEGYETDESLKSFLLKILKAAGQEPGKNCYLRAVLPDSKLKIPIKGIQRLLIFGIAPERLGWKMKLPLYGPVLLMGCNFLQVENLSAYQSEINSKSRPKSGHLWQALKNYFDV